MMSLIHIGHVHSRACHDIIEKIDVAYAVLELLYLRYRQVHKHILIAVPVESSRISDHAHFHLHQCTRVCVCVRVNICMC